MAPGDVSTRPVVMLIHGLGTTGAVWHAVASLLERQNRVDVLAPDLPGHGAARPAAPYSVGQLAAAVAATLPALRPVLVAGHSLGGYVALALASGWFGCAPVAALSLGAKLGFTAAERARAAEFAAQPARWFATRPQAVERYRRVAGLSAERVPDERFLQRGVTDGAGGFRLAADPAAFGILVPGFDALLAAARCPVLVARGEHDPLVSRAQCAQLEARTADLEGLGHNVHVEDAARVAALIAGLLAP